MPPDRIAAIGNLAGLAAFGAIGGLVATAIPAATPQVWVETIALFAWMPIGFFAWWIKAATEDWLSSRPKKTIT